MDVRSIYDHFKSYLRPYGFDLYPFLIGWYNKKVDISFRLPYDESTLAFCVISVPAMFEQNFLPYILSPSITDLDQCSDPLDQSVNHRLREAFSSLNQTNLSIELIHDYDLDPISRRPKVIMRAAGHVSGAVYYYQRHDLENGEDPWSEEVKIYGCSLHEKYGGWFAFRGVYILKDVTWPDLTPPSPPDPLGGSQTLLRDLLERINFHWRDWSFRDVVPVAERYSEAARTYFATPPTDRWELIEKWRRQGNVVCDLASPQTLDPTRIEHQDECAKVYYPE